MSLFQHILQRRQQPHSPSNCCRVVGIMTGTSLDGVDLALVTFRGSFFDANNGTQQQQQQPFSHIEVEEFVTLPYPRELMLAVTELLSSSSISCSSLKTDGQNRNTSNNSCNEALHAVCQLNTLWSREIGKLVNEFLAAALVRGDDTCNGKHEEPSQSPRRRKLSEAEQALVVVASHGQTVWHVSGQSTLQIGDTEVLAQVTRRTVVGNFRAADVACGGTGAPLVPFLDRFLALAAAKRFFSGNSEAGPGVGSAALSISSRSGDQNNRGDTESIHNSPVVLVLLQNMGGIGNATAVLVSPKSGSADVLVAFDTGPACVILNELASALVHPEGELARRIRPLLLSTTTTATTTTTSGAGGGSTATDAGDGDNESLYAAALATAFHQFVSWKKSTAQHQSPRSGSETSSGPHLPSYDRDAVFSGHGNVLDELLDSWLRHPFLNPVVRGAATTSTPTTSSSDTTTTTAICPAETKRMTLQEMREKLKFLGGRSTGREQFGNAFVTALITADEVFNNNYKSCSVNEFLQRFCDLMRTAVEFTAKSIALHVRCCVGSVVLDGHYSDVDERCCCRDSPPSSQPLPLPLMLCSGGGSQHPLIMQRLSEELRGAAAAAAAIAVAAADQGCESKKNSCNSANGAVFVAKLHEFVGIRGLIETTPAPYHPSCLESQNDHAISRSVLVLDDAKEALAFAVLGHEKLCSIARCAASSSGCDEDEKRQQQEDEGTNEPVATGASRRCWLGQISTPS